MQRPGRRYFAALAVLPLLVGGARLAGCADAQTVGPFALQHSLAAATRCHVSIPDQAALELVRERIARRRPDGWTFEISLEGERPSKLGSEPRIWIGTPNSPGCELALSLLGVERAAAGFRFLGQEFIGRGDGLIATVGDPERPGAVLGIVFANELRSALGWLQDWTPTSRTGWRDFRAGAVQREGAVDPDGKASSSGGIDVAALAETLAKGLHQGERADFDWTAPQSFDATDEALWLDGLDRASGGVRRRLSEITPFDAQWRLMLRLFDTPEELARVCRARGLAHLRALDVQPELALVHVSAWPDNAAFEVARAAAIVGAGPPRADWLLDAVAAASAESWFGRSRNSWLAHLWTGDLVPNVEQLTAVDGTLSPYLARPLRGALLLCCEEQHGADFASRHWAAETIQLPDDAAFRAWLERTLGPEIELARQARRVRHDAALTRATRRGACLLPSRPGLDPLAGGFGSRGCEKSLAQLRRLGASAVALSWCSAIEASEPHVFGAGRMAWTQADEAALYATAMRAQNLGMSVMLLPQLIATENGGWAGQVLLTTHESRRELFQAWRSFLINLGLLAELAGVDVLSLGSEAPDSSVTRVSNQNRRSETDLESLRADWRFWIEAGRSAFAGGLTYAARWDGEAQGIEFWKDLDFLGQNVFVAFGEAADKDAPDTIQFTQRIAASLAHLSQLAKLSGVRPLVCGIGISSTADGWRQPSRPQGGLDLDLQVRFYDGLRRALRIGRSQELEPAGWFTWCWWSDPESGGELDRGFTPQHKPAEAALGRAFNSR